MNIIEMAQKINWLAMAGIAFLGWLIWDLVASRAGKARKQAEYREKVRASLQELSVPGPAIEDILKKVEAAEEHGKQMDAARTAYGRSLLWFSLIVLVAFFMAQIFAIWIGQIWGNNYAPVSAGLGWLTGFAMPYLCKRRVRAQQWGLGVAIGIMTAGTLVVGWASSPLQIAGLWLLGFACGFLPGLLAPESSWLPGDEPRGLSIPRAWRRLKGKEVEDLQAKANQGDPTAQLRLAAMLAHGIGVRGDPQAAVRWCRPLAEQGHTEAQTLLWQIYDRGGPGIPRDPVEANKWLMIAAAQGNPQLIEFIEPGASAAAEELAEARRRAKGFLANLKAKNNQ